MPDKVDGGSPVRWLLGHHGLLGEVEDEVSLAMTVCEIEEGGGGWWGCSGGWGHKYDGHRQFGGVYGEAHLESVASTKYHEIVHLLVLRLAW